ncbi:hypothetical protein OFK41_07905 [Acinetobacter baumannii]|uniref:hypothetical protein n=1 Tax=Acinetobacter baumannii TaxID=470 RepID=UPI00224EA68D|nr:hypothetical protein [Acinetobacter baumannii]MCX3034131.1 hypothetical protein [Acinetobacter baumannii]
MLNPNSTKSNLIFFASGVIVLIYPFLWEYYKPSKAEIIAWLVCVFLMLIFTAIRICLPIIKKRRERKKAPTE